MTSKVLFIDRDGTLIEEPHDNQVDSLEKIRLVPGVIPALLALADNGYRFVMVSNQDGLGTESFPVEQFETCHKHVVGLFESQGITFDETFICPHFEDAGCDCRKPRTGLLTRFLARNHLDTTTSAVIGDRNTDLELAERLGLRGFLVDPSGSFETSWPGIVAALCSGERCAEVERKTRETIIRARVNLDTEGRIEVRTGIGFFDHMLEQIAKHGGFSLVLTCDGDLHVDEHHTVEDVAIVMGSGVAQRTRRQARHRPVRLLVAHGRERRDRRARPFGSRQLRFRRGLPPRHRWRDVHGDGGPLLPVFIRIARCGTARLGQGREYASHGRSLLQRRRPQPPPGDPAAGCGIADDERHPQLAWRARLPS